MSELNKMFPEILIGYVNGTGVYLTPEKCNELSKLFSELEHYKKLNNEWVKEKIEGLNTFEEVEKMVELADKIAKENAMIVCGWCNEKFETYDQIKQHALGCKENPLVQRIEKYNHLFEKLFIFLEDHRLVRAHAKEMLIFNLEYRGIKDGKS